MLQPIPIARFHPHRRVQREPIHIRAQRPLHERFVLRPAANPLVPFPGPFAERRAALHRRGGEFDQQLVVTSSVRPIDPFLTGRRQLPQPPQTPQHPVADRAHQLRHVRVRERVVLAELQQTNAQPQSALTLLRS